MLSFKPQLRPILHITLRCICRTIHHQIHLSIKIRSEILSEVQNQGSTKLPSNKSVLVLGDNAAGKTTLIAKLQGVEDPKKGSGLEYAYIDVKDEYRDGKCCKSNQMCQFPNLRLFVRSYATRCVGARWRSRPFESPEICTKRIQLRSYISNTHSVNDGSMELAGPTAKLDKNTG